MKLPSVTTVISHMVAGSLACAILTLGLGLLYWPQTQAAPTQVAAVAQADLWPRPLEFDSAELVAKAAIVYDPVSGAVLFAKNSRESLPLASLTKLMSAEAVLARSNEQKRVTVSDSALRPEGDWGFLPGDNWSVGELLRFGLVASSNDAMAAAASTLGVDPGSVMNTEAGELGLSQSYFLNPTGLDEDPKTAGGYGSAYDVAVLAGVFVREYPELFSATVEPQITIGYGARTLTADSTAGPLLQIPGLLGAKTGYTDLAGGNLVVALDLELGRPVVIAVLGSTRDGRFEDVKKLITALRTK
jgi:D-alanyl-D-alanine carboxypeptidase (penicillin-binding protein 5/6)